MTVLAPKNRYELVQMMDFAMTLDGPVAIKYPRGDAYRGYENCNAAIKMNKSEVLKQGTQVAILACGNMVEEAEKLVSMLEEADISPTLVNVRFLSSVDKELLLALSSSCSLFVTMEENVSVGGYGERVAEVLVEDDKFRKVDYMNCSIKTATVTHGKTDILRKQLGIDALSIYNKIMAHIKES